MNQPPLKALPALREELELLAGPTLAGGEPSWTIHDPVRNQFYQIGWPAFEILSRWSLQQPQRIVDEINSETTLHIGLEEIEDTLRFLQTNELLMPAAGSAPLMEQTRQRQRGSWGKWLLHHYLFIRVPLFKCDKLLSQLAPRLDFLFSRAFFQLTLLAGLFGLVGVYREWERFSSTLVDMLTFNGFVAYGLTLIVVKVLHEFGHGLTAKRHGCRVPTMGVALLVLWPVAYTDTNEVWKLTSRRQRLEVAAAGVATELTIAAWATLAWIWLPEGTPRQIAFLLSTTTWISTVLVNASPFMRFDGYFLLSDWLEIPNLHKRAFDLARWDLRERLFNLQEPAPEHFSSARQRGLIVFAWVIWIYRLVVFLGIAVLVYQFFIKAVGIFLFLVEIVWFVLMPLRMELKEWQARWPIIRENPRSRRSAVLAGAVLVLFVLPWPSRVGTSGLLQPSQQVVLYAPPHAQVSALAVKNAGTVQANQEVLELSSPDLRLRNEQTTARQIRLSQQSATAGFDSSTQKDWLVLEQQLAVAQAERSTVEADSRRYRLQAPYPGVLYDIDPDLRQGQWVSQRETLGRLVGNAPWQVVTYVDEDSVERLNAGDRALFVADGMSGPNFRLRVASIDKTASNTLPEAELANLFGGHVPVREKQGVLYTERAYYRVVLTVDSEERPRQHSWRGKVSIAADWEAPGLHYLRAALANLRREAGF